MNIVFVSTLSVGGAAQGTENTYRAFLAAGHNATFLALGPQFIPGVTSLSPATCRERESLYISFLMNHWKSITCPEKILQGATELFSDTTCGLFELSQPAYSALREADIINIHWHSGILTSLGFLKALEGKKIVFTLPDIAPFTGGCHYHLTCRRFEQECGNCPCLLYPAEEDLSRRTYAIKKQIYDLLRPSFVTLSKWQAEEARRSSLLRNRSITDIIYTYDQNSFRPLEHSKRIALREHYHINPNALVILAGAHGVGNPRKNIPMLLRALEIIRKLRPNFTFELILYGAGKAPQASFPIRHMGYLDNSKIWELYALADLFVHPAVAEALGNTLCEAQCCGTPVITFDVGGCPETYRPSLSGFCITPMTDEALIKTLIDIFDHPERLLPMRLEAKKFADEIFSAKRHIDAYINVFNDHTEKALSVFDNQRLCSLLQHNEIESLSLLNRIIDENNRNKTKLIHK
jgi:glycosyltransferase involved in cell wall biosynthesis